MSGGNVIINAGLSINRFKSVVSEDNLILAKSDPRPTGTKVLFRVNKFDPRRANLAVFNWDRQSTVNVDVSALLKPGDGFRLLNPGDFYGPPILSARGTGSSIKVPMGGEFAAFVVMKE